MTHTAYVIPGDHGPAREIEWETEEELHALILGEIGADEARHTDPIFTPAGPVLVWVARATTLDALRGSPNLRAMFIGELAGKGFVVSGTAVVTGYAGDFEDDPASPISAGLTEDHTGAFGMIEASYREALAMHEKSRTLRARFKEAVRDHDTAQISEVLTELEAVNPDMAHVLRQVTILAGLISR